MHRYLTSILLMMFFAGFSSARADDDDAEITKVTVNGSSFCDGQPVSVSYTISDSDEEFKKNNIFTAQLSNASGSFTSPIIIGTLKSRRSGVINAIIPFGTANGEHYRIRVVSSSPVVTSKPNGTDLIINVSPSGPVAGTITQPTCALSTGSVVLSGLPATETWTLTKTPGGTSTSGTGTSTTISELAPGTYTFTVTNASGCNSPASGDIVINAAQGSPSAPIAGGIIQPTCALSTGSVILSGLPATGTWTLTRTPGGTTTSGTGTTTTISELAPGTYTFTVTNASGCISAASGNVEINTAPGSPSAPIAGGITQPTCALSTGSVVLSGLPATGTWTLTRTPGGTTTSGTGTSTTISELAPGTYTFTVTNSSGCISAASGDVVINTAPGSPSAPIAGGIIQPTCAISTGSVTLSGLPATGTWTLTRTPGGTTTSGTGTSTTISELAPGTYTFTVTNASGCISAVSGNVVINTAPGSPSAPRVGAITQPTCAISTGSVVLSGLPATGTWTLTRTPGGTSTSGTGTRTTITELAPGTYTFTVTNSSGCISAASGNVVINTAPGTPSAPIAGGIIQPTCALSTGSVVLSGLPATGTWTLTRTPGGTTISGTGTSRTITGLASGTYTYTVTNALGCISQASGNVIINTAPGYPSAPRAGAITQPTCAFSTGSVVLNGLPATGAWTLTRTPGGTTTSGTGTTTTITELASGTYTFTVTNSSGCISAASGNVIINTAPGSPSAPIAGIITQPTCALSTGSVVLNGLPSTGTWTLTRTPGGTTTSGTGTSTTITGLTSGTYSFTVTNSSGCISRASANVVIILQPAAPTANAGTGGNECDLNFKFSAIASIGTGKWTQTTGTGTSTFIPDANTPDATVTVSAYGNYTFTWTETNNACSGSSNINVSFNQQPAANAGTGGNNCGLEFILGARSGIGKGTWTLVNGPGTATFSPNANTANAKVTVSAFGTHTFRWTEVNGTCSNSSTISITFFQQSSANAGNGGDECDKDFNLNAVPGAAPGIWTKIGGPGNAVFSPGANQANAKVTVSQFGSYDFAWTEANNLCTSTDIIRVEFHDLPSINAGADIVICKGGSIQLNAIGSGSFQWNPANLVNNQTISNPIATPVATSVFTVTLTDQSGCKNSDQVIIEVREQPVASAGPDQVLEYLFETTLNAAALGNGQTGEWTIISGTGEFANKNDNGTQVSKLSPDKNSYTWTITNGVCPMSYDTVNIIVHDLIIPTLITPNKDGNNEYFTIKGVESLGKTELVIFNRWGARVYINNNYDNMWDGINDNEDPLPDDTYFYVLRPEKSKVVRGYIMIRR